MTLEDKKIIEALSGLRNYEMRRIK